MTPNVGQAEGQDWQRQRKLTATPFGEQKSTLIWNEALHQADDMVKFWRSAGMDGLTSTSEDTRTVALHVLAYVAFQRSYPFKSISKTDFKDAGSLTYRDSLAIILRNALIIMVLPGTVFSIPFLPDRWKQIGWAIKHFRRYMLDQLHEERRRIKNGEPGTGNLVSNLVRASSETAVDGKSSGGGGLTKPLTETEILGNIFVFNFAGHDTTAISLAYGMLLFAAHPEVQTWVNEELRFYLREEDVNSWNYGDVFPRLKRCLSVLVSYLADLPPGLVQLQSTATNTSVILKGLEDRGRVEGEGETRYMREEGKRSS